MKNHGIGFVPTVKGNLLSQEELSGKLLAAALSSKLVSLSGFPSGLLLPAAAAWFPKLISLYDVLSGLRWAVAVPLSPKLHDFPSGLFLAAAAASSSTLISLPNFLFGLLLGAAAASFPNWLPFLIFLQRIFFEKERRATHVKR